MVEAGMRLQNVCINVHDDSDIFLNVSDDVIEIEALVRHWTTNSPDVERRGRCRDLEISLVRDNIVTEIRELALSRRQI